MRVIEQLGRLSDERFLDIYQTLETQGFGPLDGEVAKRLKFRPQAIKKLPMAQRAKHARSILERGAQADLAYELFGSYLMRKNRELITDFLDATGVPHQDGMIGDTTQDRPDKDKLADAIQQLDGKYPAEDVTLYLSLCAEQWPDVPELESLWQLRP